ncbi:Site-specific DNA recombinase [Caloramator quimbayensis]|uniref:Site-specific DNA recombinase n=1 Tax=Caloramator quimbayensis TaxID=1147123 RepID=A0A1T4XZ04_9CLOT|nr:recombinase family protein [Caloramator quimbayensis]SKA94448.1 Site-specific DNA recombinase [Caloramator quimbayensis]
MNKERVYGYVRLSRDEDDEKNSLTNQKQILYDYAKSKNYKIIEIFEDDNISGMTFDREGLNKLKEVVELKKADIILVKDLSRIGRHKAYSALFLEYLRENNVKLISVTENIDSLNENDDILIGFKQILNEQYAKDISRKIRAGFKQKQKDGFVIIPPFGYIKNTTTKQIEIFEECADIVRLIYKLYIDGYGSKKIAQYLNERQYHTPAWYHKKLYNKIYHPGKEWIGGEVWSDRTIQRIISNDAYIGVLRCGVSTRSVIYKFKKDLPEEEHIIHENFYPPIINKETWVLAQKIRENRTNNNVRASCNSKIHRYAGLLKCKNCGASFVAKKRDGYVEYVCNGYHRFGKNVCSSHRINEIELDDMIYQYLIRLKEVAEDNLSKIDVFIKEWNYKKRDYSRKIEELKLNIIELKNEAKEYAKQLAKKIINEELFMELIKDNEKEIELLNEQIKTLQEMKQINDNAKLGIQHSIDMLNNIINDKKLSNAHLQMLISKILIAEDENGMLDIEIILNMPFKHHLLLNNTFTQESDT